MTISLAERLQGVIDHALELKIATSISLSVRGTESIIIHRGYTNKFPPTITCAKTIYDLASLTKIFGTTIAVAKAIVERKIGLDETPFIAWPKTSVRSILGHVAGLLAHRRFYEELDLSFNNFRYNRHQIFARLFSIMPSVDKTRVYSDLGFIALGWLLEHRLKRNLFDIFSDGWGALNFQHNFLWFVSQPTTFISPHTNIAKTGYCPTRKHIISGQLNDRNGYFLGGLGGHAGLFSNLSTVAEMGSLFRRIYHHQETALEQLLASFMRDGLGFDKRQSRGTNRHLAPDSFGHFGYTGTSLWIDPVKNLEISLLTNRVHASENPHGIFWLRLKINEMVTRAQSINNA